MSNQHVVARCTAEAKKILEGRKIVRVRYMTEKEADVFCWPNKSVILQLDDGTLVFPSADDEGNDAGALFFQNPERDHGVIPVIG